MELIDKIGVIRALVEHKENIKDFGELKAYIDRLHSEESRPKGKWSIEAGIGCYCSNCNFDISNDFDCMEYVNYCPHCGADMRGEE